MRLILVRHGETASDEPGRCHGITDIDLSEVGYQQAETLRRRFIEEKIDKLYTSSLRRARKTAEIIAAERSLNVITSSDINEVNFGLIERKTFEEAALMYPKIADLWRCGDSALCFPEGESFGDLTERSIQFLDSLISGSNDDDAVMLVGHGGPFRIMLCHLLGIPVKHHWQFNITRGSVSVMQLYSSGAVLESFNDMSHWLLRK